MIDIIICEDNNIQRKQIEDIILKEINTSKINLHIALSTSNSDEILKYVINSRNKNFIYFLDVELEGNINGIELANTIRKYDLNGYIIFVTSHAELSLLTFKYKVQAMDYILKFDEKELETRIIDCLRVSYGNFSKINVIEKKYITLNIGSDIVNFDPNEILFFETYKNHKIRINMFNENIEFYCSLKKIQLLLPEYFYKCHRSYIVNIRNIKFIDKSNLIIHMNNDNKCYISKR
ncbi:LytR/AlgR family response regulator transcription factor, partial [Clostridium tyrobutyricum]|uniref:LytR/AlgR family response regulator transcription factor n=1 Tax=Clostridium tyrobutyricum TaxID=1519 RepID=UPI001C3E0356